MESTMNQFVAFFFFLILHMDAEQGQCLKQFTE